MLYRVFAFFPFSPFSSQRAFLGKVKFLLFNDQKQLFLILHNRDIKVNLYKLYILSIHFFILPTKYYERKLKYFLSSHFSILSLFSILPLFHSSNQTDPKTPLLLYTYLRRGVSFCLLFKLESFLKMEYWVNKIIV